ncbi:MAG TPA: helix-turn-helix domain-containing protein, partial [Thermomicrobiales bacterium]|nr:helix-turn-helix domain-containing protein [Thermomicrobiales bacterium]
MTQDNRGRRTGRRPGTAVTRSAILAAARQHFAERGYAGASFRAIAGAAGVDPALVAYYFTSKEGLFRAVLDVPVDPDALMEEILSVNDEDIPLQLVQTLLSLWDAPETGLAIASYLRRALTEPETTSLVRDYVGAT